MPASRAKRRKPRDGEASRRDLLAAAQIEFAAKGFAGARLSAIASKARIKPGLIHFHFGDKEGLYTAMLSEAFVKLEDDVGTMLDRLTAALDASRDTPRPFDRIDMLFLGEALVGLTQTFYSEHAPVLALLRNEAASGSPIAKRIASRHMKPVFDRVISRIEDLRRAGQIAPEVDARHLFASVVAMTAYPILEPLFADAIWPDGPRGEALAAARRSDIVQTALARMLATSSTWSGAS